MYPFTRVKYFCKKYEEIPLSWEKGTYRPMTNKTEKSDRFPIFFNYSSLYFVQSETHPSCSNFDEFRKLV